MPSRRKEVLNVAANRIKGGNYLLFAISYKWISKLTYCANPHGDKNDYVLDTLKNLHEEYIWDKPVKKYNSTGLQ